METRRSFLTWMALGAATLAAPNKVFASAARAMPWIGEHEVARISMDAETGEILEQENIDKRTYLASTTKIMTAAVVFHALEKGWITKDTVFTASAGILKYNDMADSCSMGLKVGEQISVDDLLKGIMVASGNDAAVVLTEGLGKILRAHAPEMCTRNANPKVPAAQRDFISFMNSTAQDMGLRNTYFQNPNGFLENGRDVNYSTAREMATMLRKVSSDHSALSKEYFGISTFHYKGRPYNNHNELQGRHPGILGGKTGFTKLARRCLGVFGEKMGRKVVAFVMHAPSASPHNLNAIRNTMLVHLFDSALVKAGMKKFRPHTFISTKDNPIIKI